MRGLKLAAVICAAAVAFSCAGVKRGTDAEAGRQEGQAFAAELWEGRVIEGRTAVAKKAPRGPA